MNPTNESSSMVEQGNGAWERDCDVSVRSVPSKWMGGVEVDPNQAFTLYKKAADIGESRGIFGLAVCYQLGIGTEADQSLAKKHYRQAEEAGLDMNG
jgi:TPR repeat protein